MTVDATPAPHEVVGGLLVRDGRVLLCHRSVNRSWYPNVWDIPGGHVEVGETPSAALVRELGEELGVAIAEPDEPEFARFARSDFELWVWVIKDWVGDPSNVSEDEHDDVAWFSVAETAGLRFADESYPDLIARVLG
jgi:mutator protein MutT